jgi:hypothetical protein
MKLNNITLQFGDRKISIAQHYSKPDNMHCEPELLCSEIAIVDRIGNCNPIEFDPNIESFMAALGKAMAAPKRDLSFFNV